MTRKSWKCGIENKINIRCTALFEKVFYIKVFKPVENKLTLIYKIAKPENIFRREL